MYMVLHTSVITTLYWCHIDYINTWPRNIDCNNILRKLLSSNSSEKREGRVLAKNNDDHNEKVC